MYYWIIQRVGSNIIAHGPWRTPESRDKNYEKAQGGEVHSFNSFSDDAKVVVDEFKKEEVKSL